METVRIDKDLDFKHIPEARRMLLERLSNTDSLVVDMSDVYRIDSAGLAGLVEVVQAARVSGRSFHLSHVRDGVKRMIAFARLDRVFDHARQVQPMPCEGC